MGTRKASTFKRLLPVVFFAVVFAACIRERWFTIQRGARLQDTPDVLCVKRVLDSLSSVRHIEYRDLKASAQESRLFFSAHYFGAGNLDPIEGYVLIWKDAPSSFTLSLEWSRQDRSPTPMEVQRSIALMKEMEHRFESECRFENLASSITQRCDNVECPSAH
jgi:hypothetical protein